MAERKKFLLRLDPQVYDAVQHWADDELRSVNAHIEFLLRRSLQQAGRAVKDAPAPRRGRPPAHPPGEGPDGQDRPDGQGSQGSPGGTEPSAASAEPSAQAPDGPAGAPANG